MGFLSVVSAQNPRPASLFTLWPWALLFLVLFVPSALSGIESAQPADPAVRPSIGSQAKKADARKDEKLEKYDVTRIGQRGIGHGFNFYSRKREHALGERLAIAFDHTTKIVTDPVVEDYINRLGQKLVRYSDADIPFTIKVIDSGDIPRAYGLPGGFLYVDSALILSAEGEAELAAVMAHEIAHVAARHATRALTRRDLSDVIGSMAMMTGPAGAGVADVGGIAGPLSVKKFSRDAEYEADLLGIEYAYAAGYDPQALLDALEKLHAIELQHDAALAKIPGYHLASHVPFHHKLARGFANYPLTEERIERLQSEIATYLPMRQDYIVDTEEFEEVKARLLSSRGPVLRHHSSGDDNRGPVLRRTADSDFDSPASIPPTSNVRTVSQSLVSNPR
ncbi:MAG: M48 family metalloprotease [Candidatus Sulfotelmatobacter sp.]